MGKVISATCVSRAEDAPRPSLRMHAEVLCAAVMLCVDVNTPRICRQNL